jgi:hypothetical protein
MIFRLDLTIELADDLTDLGQTFFLLKRSMNVRNVSAIEFDDEMFFIKYKRYFSMSTSSYYDYSFIVNKCF